MSLIGLDIGTSGSKVIVVSAKGSLLGEHSIAHNTLHPYSGYAELDAEVIWGNVKILLSFASEKTKSDPPAALSVSSMGEAVVPVTKERKVLGKSILGSDVRGEEYADELKSKIDFSRFYEINPNIISLCYTFPKVAWLRDNQVELYKKTDYFLHWADFVGFMLGAVPHTSNSLANRTLLFDIRKNDWSDELFSMTGMDRHKFAPVVNGGSLVGSLSSSIALELGLPSSMVLVAGGHDQCLNALGSGATTSGTAVCGIGTFECITPVFDLPEDFTMMRKQGLNIEHHVLPDLFVSFIYNQAGSLLNWFKDEFARDASSISELESEIPNNPTGIFTLPYFEPSGAPGFVNDMRGAIIGLQTSSTRGDILKSIMESTTYYFYEVIMGMKKNGDIFDNFIATGGGSRSDIWMQIHADVFGVPFKQPVITEGSALGAVLMAGLGVDIWNDPEEAVENFVIIKKIFEPDEKKHYIYQDYSIKYQDLYKAVYNVWQG